MTAAFPSPARGGTPLTGAAQRHGEVRSFAPRDDARPPRPTEGEIDAVARIAHEVLRAFCAFTGDDSQQPWADAPSWQRASAREGVRFFLENPDADDSATHDAWLADKRREGWTYGPVKDEALKQHPCIVPFDQLPKEQQFKDRLFRTIVEAALGG